MSLAWASWSFGPPISALNTSSPSTRDDEGVRAGRAPRRRRSLPRCRAPAGRTACIRRRPGTRAAPRAPPRVPSGSPSTWPFWLKSRLIEYSDVPAGAVGIADGQRADALRRGEVAVEQQRRGAQRRGDVVEAEVAAVVRQQRRRRRRRARAGRGSRCGIRRGSGGARRSGPACSVPLPGAIERSRQPRGERRVLGLTRTRHAVRRHRTHAQLAQHALPRRRVRRAGCRGWPSRGSPARWPASGVRLL